MVALRLSCLARNGRSPGEESLSDAVAAQAIEAQPSSGQISQREAVGPRRTASSGEDVADPEGPAQERRPTRREERSRSVEEGWLSPTRSRRQMPSRRKLLVSCRGWGRLVAAVEGGPRLPLLQARRSELTPRPSSPTCSMIRRARATPSSARVAATRTASKPTPPSLAKPPVGQSVPCARRP